MRVKGFVIFLVFYLIMFYAVFAEDTLPPQVTIETPKEGAVSSKIVEISGNISDESIQNAIIIHNGESFNLHVEGGRFFRNIVLNPGDNWIEVVAENKNGTGSDKIFLKANISKIDMKITITWDTDSNDIDLWVTDPLGEKCYYANRETNTGGYLDLDVTDGYGPETFTLSSAMCGNYLVSAHYYGDSREIKTPVNVKLEVTLFPGTPKEEKKIYSGFLYKINDVLDVANIFIK